MNSFGWPLLVTLAFPVGAALASAPCRTSELFLQARSGVVERDFDGDGKADRLRASSGGGEIELTLTTLAQPLRIPYEWSAYSFLGFVPVPEALLPAERERARDAVAQALFETICAWPDPSLAWLLEEEHQLRWQKGDPSLPETYGMFSTDPVVLRRAQRALSAGLPSPAPLPKAVWVWYSGHNHRQGGRGPALTSFRKLDQSNGRQLLGTSHGVVLYEPAMDRHAWIFIQPGGQKLRRPTVSSARFEGTTAVIDVSLRERQEQIRVDLRSLR